MTSEANRSADNLIPMCEEHAFEIDATAEHFPVELLREWKQAQLAEYQEIHRSWPISDAEAAEAANHSFDAQSVGIATIGAETVVNAARAVGMLIETGRSQRRIPQQAAAAWQQLRRRVNQQTVAYDSSGNRLEVEPAWVDTKPHMLALETALADVVAVLEPLRATLVAELHAIRAAVEHLDPWCRWVERAATALVEAAGRWPGRPPAEDDAVWPEAIDELQRASNALAAAWRGQPAEQPPPAPAEPAESDEQRAMREHRELLDEARPWARSKQRPYSAQLYARLIDTTRVAVGIPEVLHLLPFGLDTTAGLAAKVARNADADAYRALIAQAARQQPLAAAVMLLRKLMLVAEDSGNTSLQQEALSKAERLLQIETWQDPQVWADNRFYARTLLIWTASLRGEDTVRETLETALDNNPELLIPMLEGIAQWGETIPWNPLMSGPATDGAVSLSSRIRDLPNWFPTKNVGTAIRAQMPELAPGAEGDDEAQRDDNILRLASQVLRLAEQHHE